MRLPRPNPKRILHENLSESSPASPVPAKQPLTVFRWQQDFSAVGIHMSRSLSGRPSHLLSSALISADSPQLLLLGTLSYLSHTSSNPEPGNLYALASLLCISISPSTSMYKVPAVDGAPTKAAESPNGTKAVGGVAEVRVLMRKFAVLNYWRGALIGIWGVVGFNDGLL